MIEILDGIRETINYGDSQGLKLYHNKEYEDYPEHWHSGIEIIMPIEGEYTVQEGKNTYQLKTGDVIIINSSVLHSLKAPSWGSRIILQFSASLLYSVKEMETLLAVLPPALLLSPRQGDRETYLFVKVQMEKIAKEYEEKQTYSEAVIYASLIQMFAAIGRKAREDVSVKNREPGDSQAVKQKEYMETVMNACGYINQHYQENLTLEEVASISGFSKFHFTRIFKQCMDITFYEYLNQKRITKAEEFLYTTVLSITDIAMNSGFSSISAFNRTFKSIKGCSPTEYRNKLFVSRGGYRRKINKNRTEFLPGDARCKEAAA